MIVRYPTGLYSTVLPKLPSDRGNVTYLISTTTPPRSNLLFPKVPIGLVEKKRPDKNVIIVDRRNTFGDLVFSVSKSNRTETGNNVRQFEIGQILEFASTPQSSVDPMLVSNKTEIRHDTNMLDYNQMGLTSDDEDEIAQLALATQIELTNKLNILRQSRIDAEQIINVNQKVINDTTKTINALTVTGSVGLSVGLLIDKLNKKRDEAILNRDAAINDANVYSNESAVTLDQLRTISTLVK